MICFVCFQLMLPEWYNLSLKHFLLQHKFWFIIILYEVLYIYNVNLIS